MIPVPQSVLDALAKSYGVQPSDVKHFAGGHEASDGVIYAYPHKDTRRLLKIMAFSSENQQGSLLSFEERLKFMHYLGDHGASIVFPLPSPHDNLYETHATDDHLWVAYTMDIVDGRPKKEKDWDPDFFRRWGQTIGMLHRLTQQYPTWQAAVDPQTGNEFLNWRGEWQGFYEWCPDEDVKQKWVDIKQQLETLPVTRDSFGFIHNDPHIWNLLVSGDRVILLDFDVANHHWFATDIAIACQSTLAYVSGGMGDRVHNRAKLLNFLKYFMEGYTRENELPLEWIDRLDLFIAYRRILLFIVMNNWIKSRPKLHTTWKQMIMTQPEIIGSFSTGG